MDTELVPKDQVEELKKSYPYPLIDVVHPEDDPKKQQQIEQAPPQSTTAQPGIMPSLQPAPAMTTIKPSTTSMAVGDEEKSLADHRPSVDGAEGEGDMDEKKSDTKQEEDEEDKGGKIRIFKENSHWFYEI